jgi:hypothetical protein
LENAPAVGEVHERPVDGVYQRHSGGEQDRQTQDRVPRQSGSGRGASQDDQRDLGGRVEPEPEQHSDGVHLRWLGNRLGQVPEQTVHQTALAQLLLELPLVITPGVQLAEHLDDPEQNRGADRSDHVEKRTRDQRADRVGHVVQVGLVVLDRPVERAHARRDQERQGEHDRRNGPARTRTRR